MKDPKEEDEQEQNSTEDDAAQTSEDTSKSNWEKNQRIDEEGNELDPEDIK